MSVLVSVIMTAYNAENYIEDAIKSVLKQTFSDFELIIVNDASQDETENRINKFLYDSRVKQFTLKKNIGTAKGRNYGVIKASGKYIAFIDSDDTWNPDKLYKQLKFMKESNISFCYSYYNLMDNKGIFLKEINTLPCISTYKSLLKSNCIPLLTVIIKKSIIKKNKFLNVHHEDYATWLQILRRYRLSAYLFPAVTSNYREHSNSLSGNKIESLKWTWLVYRRSEKLTLFRSVYYIFLNATTGIIKHQRFFK